MKTTSTTTIQTSIVTTAQTSSATTLSTTTSSRTTTGSAAGSTSVDVKFKARGKQYFGVATDQGRLQAGSAVVIQQRFGQVTPENSMKWESIERKSSKPENLVFLMLDGLLMFCNAI